MNKEERASELAWLTDEDLISAGIDPKDVSDEEFEDIADCMRDYIDDIYASAFEASLELCGFFWEEEDEKDLPL